MNIVATPLKIVKRTKLHYALPFFACYGLYKIAVNKAFIEESENIKSIEQYVASHFEKDNDKTAQECFDEAMQLFEDEDYLDAIQLLRNIEEQVPTSSLMPDIIWYRALAHLYAKNYPSAIILFNRFIRRYPSDQRAHEAKRLKFLACAYQITTSDRDLYLIEQAWHAYEEWKKLSVTDYDEEIEVEKNRVFNCYAFSILQLMQKSQKNELFQIIKLAQKVIHEIGDHPLAGEAYYRLIEFYVNQNEDVFLKEAICMFDLMRKRLKPSIWEDKASALLKNHIKGFEVKETTTETMIQHTPVAAA
jgi:tetratricopeptide (TPR) repeat protein